MTVNQIYRTSNTGILLSVCLRSGRGDDLGEGLGDRPGERGERDIGGSREDMSEVNSGRVLDLEEVCTRKLMIFIGLSPEGSVQDLPPPRTWNAIIISISFSHVISVPGTPTPYSGSIQGCLFLYPKGHLFQCTNDLLTGQIMATKSILVLFQNFPLFFV